MLVAALARSKSSSTFAQYTPLFLSFIAFCESLGLAFCPATGHTVAIYLANKARTASSFSVIENICAAIAGIHTAVGVESPTGHPMVAAVKEAAHRDLPSFVTKKEPLTCDHVEAICTAFAGSGCELSSLMISTAISFAFAGFYRFSDWSSVRVCDVAFEGSHMVVFLAGRKTDQYREGSWQVISQRTRADGTVSPACPVTLTSRLITRAGLTGDRLLFSPVTTSGAYTTQPVSYAKASAEFKAKFKAIGLNTAHYSTHSCRAGGATAAANRGVPIELWMAHGGWRLKEAALGYIKTSLANKLSVTKAVFAAAVSPPRPRPPPPTLPPPPLAVAPQAEPPAPAATTHRPPVKRKRQPAAAVAAPRSSPRLLAPAGAAPASRLGRPVRRPRALNDL